MAMSVSGLGSGIDTAALVSSLMQAERVPQQKLTALQQAAQKQVNAWLELRTKTTALQSAAEALQTPAKALSHTATSSEPAVVTASAGEGATSTKLTVKVLALATAQQQQVLGLPSGRMTVATRSVQLPTGSARTTSGR